MNRKQKEQLRILLKARKRADKVLAARREAENNKRHHKMLLEANQELKEHFTQELTELARQSGLLALAEQAARQRGGTLHQQVSFFMDYGLSTTRLHHALMTGEQGELRASHLALILRWEQAGSNCEVEIRLHKNGAITFHNFPIPLPSFLWRRSPGLLERLLGSALQHPRHPLSPV